MAPVIQTAGPPPPSVDPAERVVAAIAAQVDRLETVLKQHPPPPVLTDKQVDDIGARLARGADSWSTGLVKAVNSKHYAVLLSALFAAAISGAAASWLAFGMPIHPICVNTQGGGRICGAWVVPETAR